MFLAGVSGTFLTAFFGGLLASHRVLENHYYAARRREQQELGERPQRENVRGGVGAAATAAARQLPLRSGGHRPRLRRQEEEEEEEEEEKQRRAEQQQDDDDERSYQFGACLMVMDDNHFLVEWLAYHWYALPLRHLTVYVDSNSKTSPEEVLRRYSSSSSSSGTGSTTSGRNSIQVDVVDSSRYGGSRSTGGSGGEDPDLLMANVPSNQKVLREKYPQVLNYLGRQNRFYQDCLISYKRRNWPGWVLLTDTDEFIAANRTYRRSDDGIAVFPPPSVDEPGSVGKWLKSLQQRQQRQRDGGGGSSDEDEGDDDNNNSDNEGEEEGDDPSSAEIPSDCINTRRTQICHYEKEGAEKAKDRAFDSGTGAARRDEDLLTQRWLYSDGLMGWRTPKSMVRVSEYSLEYLTGMDLVHTGSAHRVTPGRTCGTKPYFQIYHYHGTVQQRQVKDAYDPRGPFRHRIGGSRLLGWDDCKMLPGDDLRPWLRGFVDFVGEDEARRLLEGAGRIDGWPAYYGDAVAAAG